MTPRLLTPQYPSRHTPQTSVRCWHRFVLNAFPTTYLISYLFTAGEPMEDTQKYVREPKTGEWGMHRRRE